MTETNKILLIDDEERSRRDLEVILDFLGETVVAGNSKGWLSSRNSDFTASGLFCLALVGRCHELSLPEVLCELHYWDDGLRFIILGETRL